MVPRGTSWHYYLQINHCLVAAMQSLCEAFRVLQYFSNKQLIKTRDISFFVQTLPAFRFNINDINNSYRHKVLHTKEKNNNQTKACKEVHHKPFYFWFVCFVYVCLFYHLSMWHNLLVAPTFLWKYEIGMISVWLWEIKWQSQFQQCAYIRRSWNKLLRLSFKVCVETHNYFLMLLVCEVLQFFLPD